MKTQQIEGVVMAWLSPIEYAAQRCFQSMPGVCTYENTAHRRCHQKSAHSSMNELRADINKVCLGFVHMKRQQQEEEQRIANKNDR